MISSNEIDLQCGDAFELLPKLGKEGVTHIITDPPYSDRTHSGQVEGVTDIAYSHLSHSQAERMAAWMSYAASKWCLIMTDHMLFPSWERGLGRYTFAPVPCVIRGMTVRLMGDGPSSWAIWLVVNRPNGLIDGSKPGAYVGGRGSDDNPVKGNKPLWLMEAIIRDYTQPGDLVCDPFMGGGTTGVAAVRLGRRFIGWEKDPKTFEYASARIRGVEPLPVGYYNDNQGKLAL